MTELSFLKRAHLTLHPTAQRLFKIMGDKQSNLALALDVTKMSELLRLADELGPSICVLKTHVDILEDFRPDFGDKLRQIAARHNFLIFEDRKFADIGQTVSQQFEKGMYRMGQWADIVNAHIVPGPGIIDGLKNAKGILLLAEMSSAGTVARGTYAKKAVAMGEAHAGQVMGFICLRKLSNQPGMIHFTPGVKLQKGKDALGQRYRTVDEILIKNKSDVIIVGRDITNASNPREQAALYQKKGWEAYRARL